MIEVKVPVLPESINEATVAVWHKKPGDFVELDDVIVEIETEKVVLEVPAEDSGVLTEIKAKEGETVGEQQVLGIMEKKSQDSSKETKTTKKKSTKKEKAAQESTEEVTQEAAAEEAPVDEVFKERDMEIIAILSAVNTAVTVSVLGFLYVIGRSRSGATLALKQMYPIDTWIELEPTADFLRLLAVTVASGLIAIPIMANFD